MKNLHIIFFINLLIAQDTTFNCNDWSQFLFSEYIVENNVWGQGNINDFTTAHKDLMPMVSDILKYEHFLTPGTIVLSDGRSANIRFLLSNFQRNWCHIHNEKQDVNILYLDEKPLGIWNKEQLNYYKDIR